MQIGQKLKDLRVLKGLTQEELANRAELSKSFISQVERDLTSPSIATLVDILQCLGTNISDFFNSDGGDEQIVFSKNDYFEKIDGELNNKIEWIIPKDVYKRQVSNPLPTQILAISFTVSCPISSSRSALPSITSFKETVWDFSQGFIPAWAPW